MNHPDDRSGELPTSANASKTPECHVCDDDPRVCATVPGRNCGAPEWNTPRTIKRYFWTPAGMVEDDGEGADLYVDAKDYDSAKRDADHFFQLSGKYLEQLSGASHESTYDYTQGEDEGDETYVLRLVGRASQLEREAAIYKGTAIGLEQRFSAAPTDETERKPPKLSDVDDALCEARWLLLEVMSAQKKSNIFDDKADIAKSALPIVALPADFAARCRPAVKHYATVKAQSVLKCHRGELPAHYASTLMEESQKQDKLLDEIDAMIDGRSATHTVALNEEQDDYKRGKLDGIDAAANYCGQTLAGNHPSLAHAFRHASVNIRAFAGTKMGDACTVDGMKALEQASPSTLALSDEELAARFHLTYERLAPTFGYVTRPETRVLDMEAPNGKLMVAVVRELRALLSATASSDKCPHGMMLDMSCSVCCRTVIFR